MANGGPFAGLKNYIHQVAPHARELATLLRENRDARRAFPLVLSITVRLILWPVIRDRLRNRITASRPALALHVLRGRPLMYRVDIKDGVVQITRTHTHIMEVSITGATTGVKVESDLGAEQ